MPLMKRLSSYTSRMMLNLAKLPGLGFLQSYVASAVLMKHKFIDHAEDFEVYAAVGQEIAGDAGLRRGRRSSQGGAQDEEAADVYDDFEQFEETSSGRHPVDDYPVSDERHSYFDDDYRAH